MYFRYPGSIPISLLCLFSASLALSQTTLLSEAFDDGNLDKNPHWTKFYSAEFITIDSTIYRSAPYSCKIATVNTLAAIETATRVFSSTLPFEISENVFVESMGDEAIPLFLRGDATTLVLFLLPNGKVQLDVLKETSQWVTAQLVVTSGYTLKRWHSLKIAFNGSDTTSLYIDNVYRGSVKQKLVATPSTLQIGNRYLPHTSTFYVDDIRVTTNKSLPQPGKIYLVLCSDTGTWDGLGVDSWNVFLKFDLYTSPTGNAARVINRDFRNRIKDSHGQPLRFTWFMLDGSVISHNTNPEVRYPWISNLEMMKRYHGDDVKALGDEFSFHYHDWIWNDPDHDGIFHWNQSSQFSQYREDFIETLGHIIIEGGILPTSFRSGWHYMDNQWETCIDSLIPYRFENTSPDRHADTTEPTDNIYDWSRASLQWIPYHPDSADYQSQGNLKGWETRCMYMKSATIDRISEVFSKAFQGDDQVVTIWSHLPESDFPEQIVEVDSVIQLAKDDFPEIEYTYTTATEAMKRWRRLQDDDPPKIKMSIEENLDTVSISLSSSEPLWQAAPLVYAKDKQNRILRLIPQRVVDQRWKVAFDKRISQYEIIGVAGTDTAGNAAVQVFSLQPTGVAAQEKQKAHRFILYPVYPNPFNSSSFIAYEIPEAGDTELALFDVKGELVKILASGYQTAGYHTVAWNANGLSSGIYFCRLISGARWAVVKSLLLK